MFRSSEEEAIVQTETAAHGLDGLFRTCWDCQKIALSMIFFCSSAQFILSINPKILRNLSRGCTKQGPEEFSSYFRYSSLSKETEADSRKRLGETQHDNFVNFLVIGAEKARFEQKPSMPNAMKTNEKKTAEKFLRNYLDHFKTHNNGFLFKFSPSVNDLRQVHFLFN